MPYTLHSNRQLIVSALYAFIGLSLITNANACTTRTPTRDTGYGPHDFSSTTPAERLWQTSDGGEPLFLRARVVDTCGKPISGARVQILHANQHGGHEPNRWRGVLETDSRGAFKTITIYPGHTGGIPRHIHFIITHPAHTPLVTRLFFKNDPTAGDDLDDLAMVPEEVQRDGKRGWTAGFEFVLAGK